MSAVVKKAFMMFVLMSVLTGAAYPLAVTAMARISFPGKSAGSMVEKDGRTVGSVLIGQPFEDPKYFRGRPSATTPFPYNSAASSGSNLGPANPALRRAVEERVRRLVQADPGNTKPIPIDLVTASASGLDPHISPAAALWQASRVAKARGVPETRVIDLIRRYTENRQLLMLGEPRVNVLELNMALDSMR